MNNRLSFVFFIFSGIIFSQDSTLIKLTDTKYREDQFYFSLSHQFFTNRNNLPQNSISPVLSIGFLRDLPIDSKRQWAVAPGVGFSYKNLKTSAEISTANTRDFNNNLIYTTHRINHFLIELPLELRYRNSTPYTHKFFRTYLGFKASYLLINQNKLEGFDSLVLNNKKDFNAITFDAYLSLGFNTFNLYFGYGLNDIQSHETNFANNQLNFNRFKLGLIFYIL